MKKYALIFTKTLSFASYNSRVERIYFHTSDRSWDLKSDTTGFLFSYETEDQPIDHKRISMRFFYDVEILIVQKDGNDNEPTAIPFDEIRFSYEPENDVELVRFDNLDDAKLYLEINS